MSTLFTALLPAVLIVAASILELITQSRSLKNLRRELEGTKAIIKDTADLRNAILRSLEGSWSLVGSFSKFQDVHSQHNSEGVLILTWIPGKNHYDVIYCYSVSKAGENATLVTAICQGYSDGDLEFGNSSNLSLTLRVLSRTDLNNHPNYNKTFLLKLNVNRVHGTTLINKMTSNFETPTTIGALTFSKVS